MTKKTKEQILDSIRKLLDAKDCVVRISRELTPEAVNGPATNNFIVGKRVIITIQGTEA